MARDLEKEKKDKKGERTVHEFLLENFYNTVQNFEDVNDKARQVSGIDSIFTIGDINYACDEKAAVDYVNREFKLNTFCLELSCLTRKDELMDGWFVNENQKNNSYLFIWIDKAKTDKIESKEDILSAEIALVLKSDIYQYLVKHGWTRIKLMKKCHQIRFEDDENFGNHKNNGLKFSYSKNLPEKPINLLLTRYVYRTLPHTITRKINKEE